MKEIDWSKAPDGATHWHDEYDCYVACWVKEQEGQRYYSRADGLFGKWMIDSNPLPIEKCIPRPAAKPAWSGEGLPPVGTVCEIAASTKYLSIRHPEGARVKVYATFTDDRGVELAAFVDDIGQVGGVATAGCFRTLRTPEQIAAEERLHNVRNACSAIADTLDSLRGKTKVERAALAVVEAMIDAGYTRAEP